MEQSALHFSCANEIATKQLAAALARACTVGDCILLHGDLGAGKTTFARGFIHALCGVEEVVVSPTFTLMQRYDSALGSPIWHFDLYRLKSPEELVEIGMEDALASGISLVEWPEIAQAYLSDAALHVDITHNTNSDTRQIAMHGLGWLPRLQALTQGGI